MKLKYMGFSESTAELYIVVQCEKAVSKKVKAFFAKDYVAKDLGTDFRLHVIEEPLRRLATSNVVRVLGNPGFRNTLCGVKVELSLSGLSRMATIGGVVIVTTKKKTLYAITAGHPLSELREQVEDSASPSDEHGFDDGITRDHESETQPETDKEESLHELADEDGRKADLGIVSHDSFLNGKTSGNHDWALVELKHENWLPNRLDSASKPKEVDNVKSQPEKLVDLFCSDNQLRFSRQPAVVITSRGIQRGTLTQNKSSILMYPGEAFVETLEFVPNSESGER